jgi:predicted TIM-barrel fold metal-dependent hydrolase
MQKEGSMTLEPLAQSFSPVIDAHAHIGAMWQDEHVCATVEDSIHLMDLCGIDKACTSLSRAIRYDFREGNRVTHTIMQRYPDRIIGFCLADPRRPEESAEELDRRLGDGGFRGVKIHVSHSGVPYDDASYNVVYEKAQRYHVPVLAHTFSPSEVNGLLDAARRFPDVSFIVGHSGGYGWHNVMAAIAALPNAYFDLCCSCLDAGRVEAFVAAGGAERVLFGTDLPFLHPACDLSPILHAGLSDSDKALILGGNIARLLGEGP